MKGNEMTISGASLQFLAAAFATWCDQKSRLSAARASGLVDDAIHDALMEDYTRTRDRISALLARAEALRAAQRVARTTRTPAAASSFDSPEGLPLGRQCPAC
ncbi:MAG: hypothetical protein Q8R92_18535 [Deltaproteobacteria bacterium]|nr:hypothetical protein [Deltaproteobacteria bacterium]